VLLAALGCAKEKPAKVDTQKVVTIGEAEIIATTPAKESTASEVVATCKKTTGTVQARRDEDTEWSSVEVGATFGRGDWVRTGPDSAGILELMSGGSLMLEPNTSILVGEYIDDDRKTIAMITLEFGVARGASFSLGDVVMIKTGEGEAARLLSIGEGTTEYRLTANNGKTEIASLSGSLSITFGEVEQIVKSGEVVDLAKGKFDGASQLLALPTSVAPAVDARLHYQPDMKLNFRWKPVRNATGYKVQVSKDMSFLTSTREVKVNKDSLKFTPRESGMVAWRVAAHDARGRYGEWGDARRTFLEKDPPKDLLISPKNGTKLAYIKEPPEVNFSWKSLGAETSYRLVVSRSSNPLRKPVLDTTTALKQHKSKALKIGTYTWGVYTDDKEAHPLFLSPRRIEVQSRTAPRVKTDGIWD
jgi:hypothetical protein